MRVILGSKRLLWLCQIVCRQKAFAGLCGHGMRRSPYSFQVAAPRSKTTRPCETCASELAFALSCSSVTPPPAAAQAEFAHRSLTVKLNQRRNGERVVSV